MAHYLDFLDLYIRTNVQTEANENVAYLNTRLDSIADPLLREKVLGIIATEFEKAMVMSKKAFKVLDSPYRTYEFKQRKLFPMVFGAGVFFWSLLTVVLLHAFSSSALTGGGSGFDCRDQTGVVVGDEEYVELATACRLSDLGVRDCSTVERIVNYFPVLYRMHQRDSRSLVPPTGERCIVTEPGI
jgi:hypothetical protein